ncbi:MAG TPA: family 10 glycosylhydrolase [Candidatus Acidoferrum sp.]|nr:family 10 glycosylhydrolase [Candidatus Acidoferrum sp.]
MKNSQPTRRRFAEVCLQGALEGAATASAAMPDTPSPAPAAAIFRSDISQASPASAFTREFQEGRWQLLDYETEEGVKGVMAAAFPDHGCGELTLPLDARGPHRIYLGINYTKTHYFQCSPYGQLEVKLTGETGFRRVGIESETAGADGRPKIGVNNDIFKAIQEACWKTADLTGKSLVIRQPQAPYNWPEHANIANLAYVKLVPVAEQARVDASRKRGAVIFCTGQLTGHTSGTPTFHPTKSSWFDDEVTPYADSDIGVLVFEAMRGNSCMFRTRTGDVGTADNQWPEGAVDPLAEVTRAAHAKGLKVLASLRMIGPQYPMNREPIARARQYWKHPEWAKRDRTGVKLTNWSFAFPEVRQYRLTLMREALSYGIDGLQLHLNRSTPFVYFEEPVVRSFIARYGVDPRPLAESDPRWQAHCAGFVTQFVREVRKLVDEKPGRQLGITIYGEAHKYDPEPAGFHPLRYGCDVETWLREGLADYIMPSPKIDLALLRKWRTLAGDRVHLWPDLMPRTQLPQSYAALAKKYYEAGADGYCTWDGERRAARLSEWAAVQQLGSPGQLDRLAAEAAGYYRRVPLKYLAGFSVKESFHDG